MLAMYSHWANDPITIFKPQQFPAAFNINNYNGNRKKEKS